MTGIGLDQVIVINGNIFFLQFIDDFIVQAAFLQKCSALNQQDGMTVLNNFRGKLTHCITAEMNLCRVLKCEIVRHLSSPYY